MWRRDSLLLLSLCVLVFVECAHGVIIPNDKLSRYSHHRHNHKQSRNGMLSFLVLADWGGLPVFPYQTLIEKAIAKQMAATADSISAQFTLALGDNFYFDGVTDLEDKRFQETYETVFAATSLDTPWYFVAGNHDHNGNVSAQIAYTDSVKRWRFPDYYYKLNFTSSDGATLDVVMIDTVILCGNSDDDRLHRQPKPLVNAEQLKAADDQWNWIDQTLSQSKADYLLVAGHFPVYSVAEHGSTACLVQRLLPMLEKYKVQAYLCGHDHNLQHIQVEESSWSGNFFVVGAANFIEDSHKHNNTIPAGSLKYYWADTLKLGGFGAMQMNADALTFRFIDAQSGSTLHGQSMPPRSRT